MAHPKQNPDYYKLSKTDRLLNLSGVPITFLKKKFDIKTLNFSQVTHKVDEKVIIIAPDRQRQVFQQLMADVNAIGNGGLFAIGSHPTEQPSYEVSAHISREFYNCRLSKMEVPNVKWVDLGSPDWEYLKSWDDQPDLVVVHGIQEDSELRRIELARDFLRRSDGSTKILIAATPNILSYMTDRIRLMPDVVWQLGKRTHRVV